MTKQEFIQSIIPGAVKAQKEYGVLTSLTLAQACLESGYGSASIGNNIFGIKANATWTGKKQLVWTTEYYNGVKQKVQAYFRDYDSIDDSIIDHAKLLTSTRYKPVLRAKNYKDACTQVRQCGYATDPSYTTKLINIIEANGFQKYDNPGSAGTASMSIEFLKLGSKGDSVKALQQKLNKLGYGLTIDGDFGKMTEAAVFDFQKGHGLDADGIAGENTIKCLDNLQQNFRSMVQTKANLADETMKYLDSYKYASALYEKLAKSMK